MYKCCKCSNIFSSKEIRVKSKATTDFRGMPCFEEVEVSPCCGEDFITIEGTLKSSEATQKKGDKSDRAND